MNQSLEFRVLQKRLTKRKHNAPQKTVLTASILAKGVRISICVMEHLCLCLLSTHSLISAFPVCHSLTQTRCIHGRELSLWGLVLIAEWEQEGWISQVVSLCFVSVESETVQPTWTPDHLSWACLTVRTAWAHFVSADSNKTVTKWVYFTDE